MIDFGSEAFIQLLLLGIFFILMVLFVLTQQGTLEFIRPENRLMPPKQVWFQLIPVLGLIWSFVVINKIANSILSELATTAGDSVFADDPFMESSKPTYKLGISYATCFCLSLLPIPFFKLIIIVLGIILWFAYWYKLIQYKLKIAERAMLAQK
ncbi:MULTISPECIES: hypothetical protein [Niastella]|uniref:DUF4328 domain-containing protein n=1 Tax=Niastella soli TaxID=2821487 RepID=A0ABS3Z413_9BACT|nr:hypothetical protein [Niastella soli]MBO9204907.1 hypothetical protein [Niastella soli]